MAIPLYLAMTAAEIADCSALPRSIGYMACHFSPYGAGLSDLPGSLPLDPLLILDDRIPIRGHDPEIITSELLGLCSRIKPSALLLDFQQTGERQLQRLAALLVSRLPCPVGVPEGYGRELDCPLFLPPVPPSCPIKAYLADFSGRELWLEAALGGESILLRETGSETAALGSGSFPAASHRDADLHCHYGAALFPDRAEFTLRRTWEDLWELLQEAEALGVTKAVGLYQELGAYPPPPVSAE